MVEFPQQRAERRFDLKEVDKKTQLRIDLTLKLQFDPIGVSVQTVTGMRLFHSGKAMRRLKSERLRNFHEWIVLNCRKRSYNSQRSASGKRTMVEAIGRTNWKGLSLTLSYRLFHRKSGLITPAYLANLFPALPGGQPFHCVFLSVKAIRKNMNTALSCRNDKFVSTVVRYA